VRGVFSRISTEMMNLRDELFSNFSGGERAFLEDVIGIDLFERNSMLYNELESLLDIYQSLQEVNTAQPALPSMPQNTRDKALLCTQILQMVADLKSAGISTRTSKDVIRFCINNQTPDAVEPEPERPATGSSIRDTIHRKLQSYRPEYPELAQFLGNVDEIDKNLSNKIAENIKNENQLLRDEINLIQSTLSDPRSVSRGSIENYRVLSTDELKLEIKRLQRIYKNSSKMTGDGLKASPPAKMSILKPSPPAKSSVRKTTPRSQFSPPSSNSVSSPPDHTMVQGLSSGGTASSRYRFQTIQQ